MSPGPTSRNATAMREAVSTGDILREMWPRSGADRTNLYLGSGRAGACFDAYGLMNETGETSDGFGETVLMHADHWHRHDETGMDYHLPVGRLQWDSAVPDDPHRYRQALRLYDGRLRTEYATADRNVELRSYFHPGKSKRDLLAVEVRHEGPMAPFALSLSTEAETNGPTVPGRVESSDASMVEPDVWLGRLRVGTADTAVGIALESPTGVAKLSADADRIRVLFEGDTGHHLLLIGAADWDRRQDLRESLTANRVPEQYAASAARAWHDRWGDSFVDLPVPEYQALWARSLYSVLASFAPETRCPAPAHGWTGNNWGFNFPQDLSYVHPALLRLGHFDIAQSWVEFFRERLEDTREWTERVWGVEGTMWEWEYPIGPDPDRPYPNAELPYERFHYQIHNAAYPARMAAETARYVDDSEWTRGVAWPIVRGSARFYAAILERDAEGRWGIDVEPSMGQDEHGEENAANYLCSLFSARYTLQVALDIAEDLGVRQSSECDRWATVLEEGIAFDTLVTEDGFYVTHEGIDPAEMLGELKHPVQLNPLTFLPLGVVDEPTKQAYRMRDTLCEGMDQEQPKSAGWTLPSFALAASHAGDADGLVRELGRFEPATYVDSEWIQCYESSKSLNNPYYTTSHGLVLQALTDAFVSDYGDEVRIEHALPEAWADATFRNLHTESQVFSGDGDRVTSRRPSR